MKFKKQRETLVLDKFYEIHWFSNITKYKSTFFNFDCEISENFARNKNVRKYLVTLRQKKNKKIISRHKYPSDTKFIGFYYIFT